MINDHHEHNDIILFVQEWAGLLSLASQQGESLEQLHVFCLAHVLRRPIIIYG